MTIIWNNSYSVGLEEIDQQHQQLIILMNRLELITKYSPNSINYTEKLITVIEQLINYTVLHFSTEEVLMKMFDYPDYENHKNGHEKFVLLVSEKKQDLLTLIEIEPDIQKRNEYVCAQAKEIFEYLQNWLLNHIMKSDKLYSEFFIKIQNKAKKSGGWLSIFN